MNKPYASARHKGRLKWCYNVMWGGGSRIGAGMLRSYLEPVLVVETVRDGKRGVEYGPPGAVGGL